MLDNVDVYIDHFHVSYYFNFFKTSTAGTLDHLHTCNCLFEKISVDLELYVIKLKIFLCGDWGWFVGQGTKFSFKNISGLLKVLCPTKLLTDRNFVFGLSVLPSIYPTVSHALIHGYHMKLSISILQSAIVNGFKKCIIQILI